MNKTSLIHKLTRSRLSLVIRLVFSLSIILFLFNWIDLKKLSSAFLAASPAYIIAALLLLILIRLLGTLQIFTGLKDQGIQIKFKRIFRWVIVSDFYAFSLPGKIVTGTAALWAGLTRVESHRLKIASLLAYIRIIGLIFLLAIGIIAATQDATSQTEFLLAASWWPIAALGLVLFLLLFFPFWIRCFIWIFSTVTRYSILKKIIKLTLLSKIKGFGSINLFSKKYYVMLAVLSVSIHLIGSLAYYLLAQSIGLPVSFWTVAWLRSLLLILSILPITIADLGVREVTLVGLLKLYSVPSEDALTYSLLIFTTALALAVIGGIVEFKRSTASFKKG